MIMRPQARYLSIRHRGFFYLLATEALGAVSDNLYKIVVALFAANLAVTQGAGVGYLALSGAVLVLPYLLFSGYAGYVADAFDKRTVLIVTKALEIIAALMALAALLTRDIDAMLIVLLFTATQSAFFSPAKYGILPELFPDRELSRANGLLEMVNFIAIIVGTVVGSVLFGLWSAHIGWIGSALVVIAVAGSVTSLGIARVPAPANRPRFRPSPWSDIAVALARLRADWRLALTVVAISWFWFFGALLQLAVVLFAKETMQLDDMRTGLLQATVALGIGFGCAIAGWLSGPKVELGLVPLGGIGMSVSVMLFATTDPSFVWACVMLALLGLAGGLFIVPLNAFLQQRAPAGERGRVIAISNITSMAGVLFASGVLWLVHDFVGLKSDGVLITLGLLTLVATAVVLRTVPDFLVRLCLWMLTHSLYRIRPLGADNVPARGPALLVCNHVSFVDPLLVAACIQRFVRFVASQYFYDQPIIRWLSHQMKAIPIKQGGQKEMVRALLRAREVLQAGHVVCIFAEGGLSRTGNPLPFRRGFEKIVAGLDVPVIPVHLDRVWGSIFSFKGGRFFWKLPERLRYPVTITFGAPLTASATAPQLRQAIAELGSDAWTYRRRERDMLHLRFMRTAKRRWRAACMLDSTGAQLSFGRTLVAVLLLSRRLSRLPKEERHIGVLLPASVAGALVNVALAFSGRVPVNLNFTAGEAAMDSAIGQCQIATIVTARAFLTKLQIPPRPGFVFIEDLRADISPAEKVLVLLAALLLPSRLIAALFHRGPRNCHALATVLFSSGSTGAPKGVMLSHHNLLSNIEAVAEVLSLSSGDRVLGALPFFHAFGLTGTLWLPLICGIGAVYHTSPKEAKAIGGLVAAHRVTILISTPTFCRSYVRTCKAEDFSSLRLAIVGAEKLREEAATAFAEKFGVPLLEGYGATEMGPVVAVNVPDVSHRWLSQTGTRPGTVGQALPGVATKIVDVDTGEPLGDNREGLLLLKSPARMIGYLGDPERTASVLRDGWYVTGDIAAIDPDGFIRITDRLSRFTKIAGEMVPHGTVEAAMAGIAGMIACCVTSAPDAHRGERLVAFYTGAQELTAVAVADFLGRCGLPRLWLPKQEDIHSLPEMPVLATGKLDLVSIRKMALDSVA
jgi:acyl-[acyl-carrier-protein]-phospholipid O-acyltransferase/long-chain-fatty-acid--[acyl-carrier-protein] ligase